MKFLTPIDMTGLEVRNHRVHNVTADPTVPVGQEAAWEGRIVWNSADKQFRIYNGTAWQTLAIGSGYSDEQAQDAIQSLFAAAAHTGITVTYTDATNSLALAVTNSPLLGGQNGAYYLNRANHSGQQSVASLSDFTTSVQTLVDAAVNGLIDSAPGTLDTLNELAAALGDDPNFAATLTGQLNALDTRLDSLEANPVGPQKYAADIGGGTTITVTHNLNTLDVVVSVREVSTGEAVMVDWETASVNSITVRFATAPAAASHRVVVVG